MKSILDEHGHGYIFDTQIQFPTKSVTSSLKDSMKNMQSSTLKEQCLLKPKLRSFVKFKDFTLLSSHVAKSMTFNERRILSKIRLGVLPIRLETGRYVKPPLLEAERTCYCDSGEIESEFHVLFGCNKYLVLREAWLSKLVIPENFNQMDFCDKMGLALNNAENIKYTAKYLLDVMDLRSKSDLLYY